MLKIRYNLVTGILSGWEDDKVRFGTLKARDGEKTTELDIPNVLSDNYEDYCYNGSGLDYISQTHQEILGLR